MDGENKNKDIKIMTSHTVEHKEPHLFMVTAITETDFHVSIMI